MTRKIDPPNFGDLDEASAELILRLQLEDVESFKQEQQGKQKEGAVDDLEHALAVLEENLGEIQTFLGDRRMARGMASAVQTDGGLLEPLMREEQMASRDRAMARRLSGNGSDDQAALEHVGDEDERPELLGDAFLAELAAPYVAEEARRAIEAEDELRESSAGGKGKSKGKNAQAGHGQCESCREQKASFDLTRAPCLHEYCIDCVRELFSLSMTDESLFPPKCCRTPIPMRIVEPFLPKELKNTFEEKKVEFSTHNRIYCPLPTCAAFIKPAENNSIFPRDFVECPKCLTQTCILCKAAAHPADDCPNDPNLQAVLDLARESGWQRCYQCRRFVELNTGCNHITCRCRAQFCYDCGLQWKTCQCPQWTEARLYTRANQILQRGAVVGEVNREERVQDLMNALQENHDCVQHDWRYVEGANRCEECHCDLPNYIFECTVCQIRVCNRCRRNRL